MPTGVKKSGSGYVAYDKKTGRTLTKPTSKKNAGIYAGKRDQAHKKPAKKKS